MPNREEPPEDHRAYTVVTYGGRQRGCIVMQCDDPPAAVERIRSLIEARGFAVHEVLFGVSRAAAQRMQPAEETAEREPIKGLGSANPELGVA